MPKDLTKIAAAIRPIVALSDQEFSGFTELLEHKSLGRDEYLLQEGQVCDFIGFVNQGTLIYFKSMENGNQVTTDFAFEGDWVTNNLSRLTGYPSALNIKAIEDSQMLMLKQAFLEELYSKIPKSERLGRVLMEQAFLRIVTQSIDLQVLSASERYISILARYPEIIQKVPLYHIANYLGIAPKSLSRIRKEIAGR